MNFFRHLLGYIRDLAQELGDESAYRRYLAAHGRAASREEWKQFSEERHRRKYANAKCC